MDKPILIQRGFRRKQQVLPILQENYASALIDWIRRHDQRLQIGETEIVLAREFGFCYGVDRAIQYAYETRLQFPDRRIFLTGEIIHNPYVNRHLQQVGIHFLPRDADGGKDYQEIQPEDVVIIPAFGVPTHELDILRKRGAILVDTTCGSVMNVWKSVREYARRGFTSIIHGKYHHEETRATASQAVAHGGHFLVVLNRAEAQRVAAYIRSGEDKPGFMQYFAHAMSARFDPDLHLQRIGLANQTTMLMNESLEIQEILRAAMRDRYGPEQLENRFWAFETICSATQDRQNAVQQLLEQEHVDLMIVIGGFNSSNTGSLLNICKQYVPSYHIESPEGLLDAQRILHKPYMKDPVIGHNWLPQGPVRIGVTAGASTPNSVVAMTILRLLELRGEDYQHSDFYKETEDLRKQLHTRKAHLAR